MRMSKLEKKFVNSKMQAEKNIKIAERLFGEIDSSNVKRVLEVGCGVGIFTSYLARKYEWDVTGIDLDPEQIKRAKSDHAENERLRFLEADATELAFERGEFDMVLSFDVLHHIRCWDRAIAEIGRVLKPKGFYILNDLAFSRLAVRVFRNLARNYMSVYAVDDIINCLTRNDFRIVVHKEKPEVMTIIMKYHSMVAQKIRSENGVGKISKGEFQ